ncbi:pH-response regulator protein palA/rim20 [Rhodotorula kratochvilovae]
MSATNLLALPLKPTDSLPSLADDVLAHIAHSSDTTHPDALRPDALAWQTTRERIFGSGAGLSPLVNQSTLPLLQEYYGQLTFILTKLPTEIPSLAFPWYPLFTSPTSLPSASATGGFPALSPPLALPNLEYERASVLYNLAALHAVLGTERRRSDEQGIKAAIASYQNAAGVLSHLLTVLPRLHASLHGGPTPADLAALNITALRDLCLAQAQEVAWQKAVMDRLKNGTVAKVAMRVAELYAAAREAAELARAGSESAQPFAFPEEIIRYLAIKHAHFTAVAHYRRSLDDLGANRYGDELGRLQLADQKLKEAGALGKRGVPEAVVQDLKSLQKIITENLARATKDNDLIYLAHPTPPSSLPSIAPAALARPTLAPELADPLPHLRAPLFAALVPREVGAVLELWEDRKRAALEEAVLAPAKELDQAAGALLAQLGLPAALEAAQQPLGVPSAVLDAAARVQAEGGVERLVTMMKDVRRVAAVNARMLQEANESLDREAATDASHREGHGSLRWTRASSSTTAQPLRERAQQLAGLLGAAAESDGVVRGKFGEWEAALRVLEGGQAALAREIPASSAPAAADVPEAQRAATRALRALLDQLADVRAARARVVDAARTSVAQAEIRDKVLREAERRVAAGEEGGLAAFEELLQREGDAVMRVWEEEMRRSEGKQEDLLGEIKAQHSALQSASAAPSDAQQARERATAHYAAAGDKYAEMLQNLQEGLRFYADLSKLLGELRDACKSFDYARTAEAQDLARALSAPPPAPSPVPASAPAPAPALAEPAPAAAPAPGPPPATPRTRRTAAPAAATPASAPRRSTRRMAATQSATAPEPEPEPVYAPKPEPEVEEDAPAPKPVRAKKEKKPPAREREREMEGAQAVGGWDPTQGIRFG